MFTSEFYGGVNVTHLKSRADAYVRHAKFIQQNMRYDSGGRWTISYA
jgi:hypothetical protein